MVIIHTFIVLSYMCRFLQSIISHVFDIWYMCILYIYIYIYHMSLSVCIYIYKYRYRCIYICMICMYIYICIYSYIYIHIGTVLYFMMFVKLSASTNHGLPQGLQRLDPRHTARDGHVERQNALLFCIERWNGHGVCIFVYMYICIYVYMYICIYVYMYICIYVDMHTCIYVDR